MESILYLLVWAALFLFMMRFGCGAHVLGHGHTSKNRSSSEIDKADLRWIAPETAIDPVCRTTVHTKAAKSAVHDGHVFYFCSRDCRERFEAAPESYLASEASAVPERVLSNG